MSQYSKEFKEKIVQKMMPPNVYRNQFGLVVIFWYEFWRLALPLFGMPILSKKQLALWVFLQPEQGKKVVTHA